MKLHILITILTLLLFNINLFSQDQMFDVCPLKVGEEVPKASLIGQDNVATTLGTLTKDKPTVIIFYRGAWCGYCTKHLAELNDIKTDIEELGYQIFGVTVDQVSKLDESTKESGDEIAVYSDSKLEAIKAFGLDWQLDDEQFQKYKSEYKLDLEEWSGETHHALPVPGIYIIKENQIAFQYVNPNYNTRLKPQTLLSILKTL